MDVFFLTLGRCGLEDDAGGCTEGERRDNQAIWHSIYGKRYRSSIYKDKNLKKKKKVM